MSRETDNEFFVRTVQGRLGIKADGWAGKNTLDALDAVLKPKPAVPVVVSAGASSFGEAIIAVASRFVGLSELSPNTKWDDLSTKGVDASASVLEEEMRLSGWQPGWAYCIAFAETVVRIAAAEKKREVSQILKMMNPSVMSSFNALKGAGLISLTPTPGSVFFMQNGSGGTGHAGIVVSVVDGWILTIEANTSPTAADTALDREGDGIYKKRRKLDFTVTSGLHLRGFLNFA